MKKLLKQLLAVTTAIMMAITLLPAMANAEENVPEKGKLQIIKHGKDEGTLLGGAEFTFYKLASITNSAGTDWKYTVVGPYRSVLGEINEKNLNDLPSKTWEEKTTIDELSVLAESDTTGIKSGLTANEDNKKNNTKKGYTNPKNLDFGVYLVKETTTPSGHVAGEPFIVSIPSTNNYNYGKEGGAEQETGTGFVYNIVAAPKNSEVPITKTADDTSVAIGQTVNYTVNTTIPKYGTEYFYEKDGKQVVPKFEVYDTLSEGLTLNQDSITVKVGDTTIDSNNYITDFNTAPKTFLLSFKSDYLKKMETSQAITITYSATVNKNAVYKNGNTAGVEYSNKPGENKVGDPVEIEEDVYTYGIDLTKTGDKDDDKAGLNGAEFTLSSVNGELLTVLINEAEVKVNKKTTNSVATVEYNNANGKLVFKGLAEGTYKLTETKAPAGYTLLKNPITIVIEANNDGTIKSATVNGEPKSTLKEKDETTGEETIETGVVPVEIKNHSGFTLPGTGGMGTYIFTIGGLVVMAGAVLLLVSSKKKRA